MIADYIVADSYLLARLRRHIADDMIAGLFFFLMSILNTMTILKYFYFS
jgi:hypothetical protein